MSGFQAMLLDHLRGYEPAESHSEFEDEANDKAFEGEIASLGIYSSLVKEYLALALSENLSLKACIEPYSQDEQFIR